MDKFLCVVLGQEYVKPMIIYGDNAIELLVGESKHFPYVYCIYRYSYKLECFYPSWVIQDGKLKCLDSTKTPNVFVRSLNA